MPVEERRRAELFEGLAGVTSPEQAGTLFEMFDDLATKADLEALRREVRDGFDRVDARFEQVDARFEQMARSEYVDERFESLRDHIDVRFEAFRNELVATFERGLREAVVGQTRIIVFSLLTAFVAVAALALGAARIA